MTTSTPTPTVTTPITGSVSTEQIDDARRVVAEALTQYAAAAGTSPADGDLAQAMARNVRGWTHTTRLRHFLTGVNR